MLTFMGFFDVPKLGSQSLTSWTNFAGIISIGIIPVDDVPKEFPLPHLFLLNFELINKQKNKQVGKIFTKDFGNDTQRIRVMFPKTFWTKTSEIIPKRFFLQQMMGNLQSHALQLHVRDWSLDLQEVAKSNRRSV